MQTAHFVIVALRTATPLPPSQYRAVNDALLRMGLESDYYDQNDQYDQSGRRPPGRLPDSLYMGEFMAATPAECAALVLEKVQRVLMNKGIHARLWVTVAQDCHCVISDVQLQESVEADAGSLL